MTLEQLNELSIDVLTIGEFDLLCAEHNVCAVIESGKLVGFGLENGRQ